MEKPESTNKNPIDPELEKRVKQLSIGLDFALFKMIEYGKTYVQQCQEMPPSYPMNELDLHLDELAKIAETCGTAGCLPLAIEYVLNDLVKCVTYTIDKNGVVDAKFLLNDDETLYQPTKVLKLA